jgi:hypothetical protein
VMDASPASLNRTKKAGYAKYCLEFHSNSRMLLRVNDQHCSRWCTASLESGESELWMCNSMCGTLSQPADIRGNVSPFGASDGWFLIEAAPEADVKHDSHSHHSKVMHHKKKKFSAFDSPPTVVLRTQLTWDLQQQ